MKDAVQIWVEIVSRVVGQISLQILSAFSSDISSGNSMLTWKNVEKESVMVTHPGSLPGMANRTLLRDSWTGVRLL